MILRDVRDIIETQIQLNKCWKSWDLVQILDDIVTCVNSFNIDKLFHLEPISLIILKVLYVLVSQHHTLNLIELITIWALQKHLFSYFHTFLGFFLCALQIE